MYNNFNYPNYFGYQQQPAGMGIKGRPVGSLEEARAANIDFDGSLFLFPDIANKKIYSKQINSDGTVSFLIYSLSQEQEKKEIEYVTKAELDAAINDLKASFPQKKDSINF